MIELPFLRIPRFLTAALVLLCLLVGSAVAQQLVPIPKWSSRVVDQVGLLQPAQQRSLEAQLKELEQSKGSQIGVLIVPTTGAETIDQFGIRVMDTWKPGRKEVDGVRVDDGLLILIATADRKMRIEVGYGLEGAVPDVMAKRIVTNQIAPSFRQGDYFGGLQRAVSSVTSLVSGESLPAPRPEQQREDPMMGFFIAVFVGFVVGSILIGILGRFLGTVGGMIVSGTVAKALLATLFGTVGSVFAVLFVLSMFGNDGGGRGGWRKVGPHTYRRRGPVIWGGGFGGGSGGFGGGGGGGFGGGFGGGGGGGGASGGW